MADYLREGDIDDLALAKFKPRDPTAIAAARLQARDAARTPDPDMPPPYITDMDIDVLAGEGHPTDMTTAARAGIARSGAGSIGRIIADPWLQRLDAARYESFQRDVMGFQADTGGEVLAEGAAGLAAEVPTLFTPAGKATGAILRQGIGRGALAETIAEGGAKSYGAKKLLETAGGTAARSAYGKRAMAEIARGGLAGRTALAAAQGAGMFGMADAARELLSQQANGTGFDPGLAAVAGAKGLVTGAAVGPMGLLPGGAAVRIPAESVTMATVGAAFEGKTPTVEDIAANVALFGLMHIASASPRFAKQAMVEAKGLVTALREAHQGSEREAVLIGMLRDADPDVVDTLSASMTDKRLRGTLARVLRGTDDKIDRQVKATHRALSAARERGDMNGVERATHELLVLQDEQERQNEVSVRAWNNAVDSARRLRGGEPPASAESPSERGNVRRIDEDEYRFQLTDEAQRLRSEIEEGLATPQQTKNIQRRMTQIRAELEKLPQPQRGPEPYVEPDVARDVADATMGVLGGADNAQDWIDNRKSPWRPVQPMEIGGAEGPPEPGAEATPPAAERTGPLTYEDMPDFIPKGAREHVRATLAEAGVRGQRRKQLMSGPDAWKKAAWAYYQATGELPPDKFAGPPADRARPEPGAPENDPATSLEREPAERRPPAGEVAPPVPKPTPAPEIEAPIAPPGERWTGDRGAIPGEAAYELDVDPKTGEPKAGIIEIPGEYSNDPSKWQAMGPDGEEIAPPRDSPKEAAVDAETWADTPRPEENLGSKRGSDSTPILTPSKREIRQIPDEEGDLFDPGADRSIPDELKEKEVDDYTPEDWAYLGAKDYNQGIDRSPAWTDRGYMTRKDAENYRKGQKWQEGQQSLPLGTKAGVENVPTSDPQPEPEAEWEPINYGSRSFLGARGSTLHTDFPDHASANDARSAFLFQAGYGENGWGANVTDLDGKSVVEVFPPDLPKGSPPPPLPPHLGGGTKPPKPPGPPAEAKPHTIDEIISGVENTLFTKERHEAAKAKFKRLAEGKDLGANPFADPELLGALIDIGGFHIERYLRAGGRYAKDIKDHWVQGVRAEIEGLGAKISPETVEWLWNSPAIQQAVKDAEKEVARGPSQPEGVRGGGEEAGRPSSPRGGRPSPEPAGRPPGPEVPGGPGDRAAVGKPRDEPGGGGADRSAGGSPEAGVPGDRGDTGVQGDVRLSVDRPVELTPAKRKAANEAAEKILREKTAEETTAEDREILRQYTGHGGLKDTEGQGHLWQHYTSYRVVDFVWKKLAAMGWKGKRVLEPAAGIGNFIGFKPEGVKVDAVELDPIASEIARRLYPEQNITTGPFEQFLGGDGKYDLVIGNPPFMEVRGRRMYAPAAAAYKDVGTLHDFFVVKGIDQLKPGGVLTYVVSTGFMDKLDATYRKRIYEKAELVAAYRLPSGVFDKNTGFKGSVDVLFFRKRTESDPEGSRDWLTSRQRAEYLNAKLNDYWSANPDRVLGRLEAGHGQQYMGQVGVIGELTPEIEKRVLNDKIALRSVATEKVEPTPAQLKAKEKKDAEEEAKRAEIEKNTVSSAGVPAGQHFVLGQKVYVAREDGRGVPYQGSGEERVAEAVRILDLVDKVRNAMLAGKSSTVNVAQTALRKALDTYVTRAKKDNAKAKTPAKSYAWLKQDRLLNQALVHDPRVYTMRELVRPDGTYADIVSKTTIFSNEYARKKKDFSDFQTAALEVARRYGDVDAATFRTIYTGANPERFDAEMQKRKDWNRTTDGWMHDSDYLFGDLRARIKEAEAHGWKDQAAKLRAHLPVQATPATWKADLSAGWIPEDVSVKFVDDVYPLGARIYKVRDRWELGRSGRGQDFISTLYVGDKEFHKSVASRKWIDLILDRLNGRIYKPRSPKYDNDGYLTEEGVTEKEAKALNDAVRSVDAVFNAWTEQSGQKAKLVEFYNDSFRSWRDKEYSRELEIDDFSTSVFKKIHPWQARVVNWLTHVGRGINAIETGGGKTLTYILLGQKLIQEGFAKKPLYVVPGKTIQKWAREYQQAFPKAKVLNLSALTGQANSPKTRYQLLQRAALNNWDAVFMTYEGFKEVPMSEGATVAWFEKQIAALRDEMAKAPKDDKKSRRNVERAILSLEEKLAKALDFDRTNTIDFERMGFDALFIDEAHNFKNVPVAVTGLASELNMGGGDAQRAIDMDLKTNYVLGNNGNRNVFMATATPTPNAPIEIYTMTRFIAPDIWASKGVTSLHSFLSTFADVALTETSDMGGHKQPKSVIVGFKEFQDLKAIRERLIYARTAEQMTEEYPDYEYRQPDVKRVNVFLQPSPEHQEALGRYLKDLRAGPPDKSKMLPWKGYMLMKARKLSVALGLVDPKYEGDEHPNHKLNAIADRLADNYHDLKRNPPPLPDDSDPSQPALNGHLVFLDLYGKAGNPPMVRDLYLRLTDALVKRGVPADEIGRISGSENASPNQKAKIQDAYNAGRIRVLIGNTMSMGEGMDLQKIGTHLYHWDETWNPSGMHQREGRIVRQGNPVSAVEVLHFVTVGTLDQFMYGKLAQKDRWGKNLYKRHDNYVVNEFAKEGEDLTLADLERALDPGEQGRAVHEAREGFAEIEGRLKIVRGEILRHEDIAQRVGEEIAERGQKVAGYLGKRAESKEADAFQHVIEQHESAIAELEATKDAAERELAKFRLMAPAAEAEMQQAQERLKAAERIRDMVNDGGKNYPTAVQIVAFEDAGITPPKRFNVADLADVLEAQATAIKLAAPGEALGAEADANDLMDSVRSIRAGEGRLLEMLADESSGVREAWKKAFGEPPPKVTAKRTWTGGGGPADSSLGAGSAREMYRKEREYTRYLVEEARRMGIGLKKGDVIPNEAEVQARSAARVAATSGKKPAKPMTPMQTTAVRVPKEGLPLSAVERAVLHKDGKVDEKNAELLGRASVSDAEFAKFTPGEKMVHLSRRIMAATDATHLQRIVSAPKYKVWTLPKDTQAALTVQIGRRIAEAGTEAIPPALRAILGRMDRTEAPGIATGRGVSHGQGPRWVFTLLPSRIALKDEQIIEGSTGLRAAYEQVKREWNLFMHYGETELFRDPQGKKIKTKDVADEIIYKLLDNPDGNELHVERPVVKLDSGKLVVPEEWHRQKARELVKILEEFADRQGLSMDRRQKYYATRILDRVLALETATKVDKLMIHRLAKEALEGNYDGPALNKIIGWDELPRNKALQIIDMLEGKRPPKTMKALRHRVEAALGADETANIPREVFQPYLKERKGHGPYKQSALLMYETYVRYALRKIHIEPSVHAAKPIIESWAGKGQRFAPFGIGVQTKRDYAEQLIERVLGQPTGMDVGANAFFESLNRATAGNLMNVPVLWRLFKPNLPTRAATMLTKVQYLRLLGGAFDSALTNLTQGVNTLARFGPLRTIQGYAKMASPAFWKQLSEEHLMSEFQSFFAGPQSPFAHPFNLFERVALYPFTFAEFINRGAAFAAGLEEAKARGLSTEKTIRLGLGSVSEYLSARTFKQKGGFSTDALAQKAFGAPTAKNAFFTSPAALKAREGVINTQFGYSPVESSPAVGTPGGRLMLQFFSYPTQQAAFLADGLSSGLRSSQYGQAARFLALIGATISAPFVAALFGADWKNFMSMWSLMPRGFGPTPVAAYNLWRAASDDRLAVAELKRDYPPEFFRFAHKFNKHGAAAFVPWRKIEKSSGTVDPRAGDRSSFRQEVRRSYQR